MPQNLELDTFDYDGMYTHMSENQKVTRNYTVADYLYGRCHLYAMESLTALNKLEPTDGWELCFWIDTSPIYESIYDCSQDIDLPALVHAFCVKKEDITRCQLANNSSEPECLDIDVFDARGLTSFLQIYQTYECISGLFVADTQDCIEIFRQWCNGGLIQNYEEHEKQEIRFFIKNALSSEKSLLKKTN